MDQNNQDTGTGDVLDGTPPAADTPPVEAGGKPDDAAASSGDILDTGTDDGADKDATKDVLSDDDASGDEGVPEKYTFDVSDELKEKGFEIDETKFEVFSEKAKEMGLSQDQFQGIIEYQYELQQEAQQTAVAEWEAQVNTWREDAKVDPDFGGENYAANVKAVGNMLKGHTDADFIALLKSPSPDNPTGMAIGNHPVFLRNMNRIAKVLSDTDLVLGEDVQKDDATEASLRRMYPTMYPKSA